MRAACELVADVLAALRATGGAGRDDGATSTRMRRGAGAARQAACRRSRGTTGFPATLCTSVNEEVIHGIPGPRALQRRRHRLDRPRRACSTGSSATRRSRCRWARSASDAATLLRVTEESLYRGHRAGRRSAARVSDIGARGPAPRRGARVLGGARVRRPRRRDGAARGAAGAELRPGRARAAAGRGHDAGHRADGDDGQGGGEGARGRLDGGDEGPAACRRTSSTRWR